MGKRSAGDKAKDKTQFKKCQKTKEKVEYKSLYETAKIIVSEDN